LFVVSAKNDREESLQALNVRLKVDDTAIAPEGREALERPYMPLTSFQNIARTSRSKSCWTE